MKCRYCGSNLAIEDEVCPYCGKPNPEAAGQRATMKSYREEFEQTKDEVKKKSVSAGRVGRLIVIGIMLAVILYLKASADRNADFDYRYEKSQNAIAGEVEKNRDTITATVRELEENRDYLGLEAYVMTYRLRGDEAYLDYSRVFTAVVNYRAIFEDILSILDGYDGYGEKTQKDWCDDAALYINNWASYVEGGFWSDSPTSPMHAGAHGEFLSDIKQDTQDMVQVYFRLTDEQASAMWRMETEEISEMLYAQSRQLYPEEGNK